MPSAPRFHVTQDAAFVYVHVHVPYVRVSEMEFHVDGRDFSFYCKPYLLKLSFPHAVVDDELAKAVYDPNKDNGTIVVHLPKQEPGLEFPDLDLLTKLMQPKKAPPVDLKARSTPAPLIEVIQSTDAATGDATDAVDTSDQSPAPTTGDDTLLELEKRFEQVQEAEEASYQVKVTALKPRYGFNNAYSDVFRGWHGDTSEILSLPDPENTPVEQRRILREKGEDAHFDIERYLLDYANASEDEYLAMALEHIPHWRQHPVVALQPVQPVQQPPAAVAKRPLIMEVMTTPPPAPTTSETVTQQISTLSLVSPPPTSATAETTSEVLTDADRELLTRLPNKEYLITRGSSEERVLFGGLVDILIGYVYEQMTTQGDSGIESTWTISILSPTLSWLDSSADVATVVRAGVRRMLTYPLLRQYDLAVRVVQETTELLRRGKRVVLHSLLDLFRIVEKSETQYLLNTIFVQDYCIWIQTVRDEQLVRLADDVAACLLTFRKADSGWALEELERQLLDGESEEEEAETSGESSSEESSDEEEDDSSSDDEEGDGSSDEDTGGRQQ